VPGPRRPAGLPPHGAPAAAPRAPWARSACALVAVAPLRPSHPNPPPNPATRGAQRCPGWAGTHFVCNVTQACGKPPPPPPRALTTKVDVYLHSLRAPHSHRHIGTRSPPHQRQGALNHVTLRERVMHVCSSCEPQAWAPAPPACKHAAVPLGADMCMWLGVCGRVGCFFLHTCVLTLQKRICQVPVHG
jgi:hypothetical protein